MRLFSVPTRGTCENIIVLSTDNQIMNYCVVALLDALNTKNAYVVEQTSNLSMRWNVVDAKMNDCLEKLKVDLGEHKYESLIYNSKIFDNFQISIPTDNPITPYLDWNGRNSLWWTIQHIAELLIPFFRFCLINKIFLRGCISVGKFFKTYDRIFGPVIDEASEYFEKSNWIGIMASPSARMVLNSANNLYNFDYLIKYPVPIKTNENSEEVSNTFETFSINWKQTHSRYDVDVSNREIEGIILAEINSAENSSQILKWQNTLNFLRS